MKVLFIFGPNLGALGRRDPEIYGGRSLDDVMGEVVVRGTELGYDVTWRQSDDEGALVGWLLAVKEEGYDAVIVNPGALTHYSYAVRDAVEASELPVLEVHFTNIFAREGFRRRSVISDACVGTIVGLGAGGYHVALEALRWITR